MYYWSLPVRRTLRSVHLDARMISPRYGMKCGDFLTCFFVQQVARYGEIPPRCVIDDFVQRVARDGGFNGVHYFKKVYVDYSELR